MTDDLKKEVEGLKETFREEIGRIQSQEHLKQLRDKYLSRKRGAVTLLFNRLKEVPPENRAAAGKEINALKLVVEEKFTHIKEALEKKSEQPDREDYSLPEFDIPIAHVHLLSLVRTRIEDIFLNMGYGIAYGPEVETEYYNFAALNFQENHPAWDEQDTFFVKGFPETILRTHTSPVQIRYMEKHPPPIKIISPGRVFRKDEPDATHTPVFNQVEGLLVDRGIHFSHLKGTLEVFIKAVFGENIDVRFRPGYFPFTEPSAEVDISCFLCFGNNPGCRICKGTGWLEILGSGMVHPNVLRNCRIDPDEFSGFAFGMGIGRIAMLKYGINDLRTFYDNDLRFIQQFG